MTDHVVRFTPELDAALEAKAKDFDTTVEYLIREAVMFSMRRAPGEGYNTYDPKGAKR